MRKFGYITLIVVFVAALVPVAAAQDDDMMGPDVIVTLEPTDFAEGVGLAGVTGRAHVVVYEGSIHITLEPNGATLPDGTVLEGWVVDAGLNGGPGQTNASDADEAYGTSFGDPAFDETVEAAPYALSTGVLTATDAGTWEAALTVPGYNFSPYDVVVVTAESDGNSLDGYDPRPGTPVFSGLIADGEPAGDMMMGDEMSDDEMSDEDMSGDDMSGDDMSGDEMGMMGEAVEVVLEATPLAEGAGLVRVTGSAAVYSESGTLDVTINLNGAALPEGAVLEGWVVDAGLDGGPGTSSVTDNDEQFGTPFGDAAFDAFVESAPYALGTGVLYDNMDGTLTLSYHIPAYNFSPYDAIVITLESDGDTTGGFDPRPGTPVLSGAIAVGDGM
jgi:hypothetical protein